MAGADFSSVGMVLEMGLPGRGPVMPLFFGAAAAPPVGCGLRGGWQPLRAEARAEGYFSRRRGICVEIP